ncbi:MAG: acylase, partial [Xanthomonadales bacterium]|nr:acylase [Xanthomonadales bacterium]
LNPATGWLQNANDPPWTSTMPTALDPDGFPPYFSDRGMAFRPQRAAHMLLADESISFEELVAIKHDTQLELAERLLDDLLAAATSHGDERALAAGRVLQA